jgi:periplasmic divalent cation tolerance protein
MASLKELGVSGFCIILSTCSNQAEAERVAHALVESRLAACVNMLAGAQSIYRWEDKVECSTEVLLVVKTSAEHVKSVERVITSLHSYSVPEILVLEVSGGSERYLAWLADSLK